MIRILGIDPGTNSAGAAVYAFDEIGRPQLEDFTRIVARSSSRDKDTAARERIAFMVLQLAVFAEKHRDWIQAVAYERAFHRGLDATTYLMHCTGAMLALSAFDGKEILPVYTQSVKAVQGAAGVQSAPNPSRRAQEDKRKAIKAHGVLWFNALHGYSLTDDQNEIADAAAVTIAGFKIYQTRHTVQGVLLGKGSRRGRKAVA